jgi:hypothetical protein
MLTLAALYWFPIRRWMNQWGAIRPIWRVMAGDSLLRDPTYSGTTAVTVNARPENIWPWLVQIGYQRGGLYSYDWLDRLFGYLDRPSATRILPAFQHLAALVTTFRSARPRLAGGEPRAQSRAGLGHEEIWAALIGCGSLACTRLTKHEHDSCRAAASVTTRCGPAADACDRAGGISHDAPHAGSV